ncbi:MAG: cobalamin-dependent protein [Candidatus Thermoplasmatota archaeon]|nr:cobalamin-dependent protein [Candidatus Thermoplasmatota archaeon]
MKPSLAFVEPPRTFWFVMGEYLPPPSSLLILAAYVERELPDLDIDIVDCQADRLDWKDLAKYIESAHPSIVLTSGFTTNAYTCAKTCEIAKTVSEDITTIVGGIHFSFTPEESLQNFPEIDYIIRGEGERTLVDLIKTLQRKGKIGDVKGISYRHNDTIIHTPPRPLIENLDTLPYPAYHLVEKNLKRYHFTMMAGRNTRYMILEGARGCEHKCSFCTQWNHWGGRWRTKSAKRIADEIEFLNDSYGGVFLWLADDHMRLSYRGKQLYEELRKKQCKDDIMLFFQARTDDIAHNPTLIGNLREVGTYWILCGVETDSQELLQEYKKGISTQDAYQAIKIMKQNDVFSQAMFVIGARNDTHESIERLRRYSLDLTPDIAIYTALTPFPGTVYYEAAKKNGWIMDANYAHYDMAHAIMPTETLTRKEVQEELWRCYRAFYGSIPKNIAGVFAKNKLKRILYRHMAGQFVLEKFRRLI